MKKLKHLSLLPVSFKENDTTEQQFAQMQEIDDAQMQAFIATVESNPGLLADAETKGIYDTYMAQLQQPAQQQQQSQQPAQQQQQAPVQQQQQQVPKVELTEDEFLSGPEGGGLFTATAPKPNFEKVNETNFPKAVQQVFGVDTTKPEWMQLFLKDVFETKDKTVKLSEVEEKYKAVSSDLERIPPALLTAMQVALKDGDWRKAITNLDVDFTKPFDKLPVEEQARITKRFIPDLQDDLTNPDSPLYKASISLGREKYLHHQESIRKEAEAQLERAKQDNDKFQVTVKSSVSKLKEKFPNEANEVFETVEDLLSSRQLLARLFYNEDGSLKPDAAEIVTYAKFGKSLYEKAQKTTNRKAVNEELANVINGQQSKGGGASTPNVTQTQDEQVTQGQSILKSYAKTY